MSEPSEWALEKARDCTYRLLKGAIVSPAFEATVRDRYARALDEARAAGREEAAKVADVCATERQMTLDWQRENGNPGNVDALTGKHSEAVRIAEAIRRLP